MKIGSLALPLMLAVLALPGAVRAQSWSGQSSGTASIGNPYMLCFTDGFNLARDACFTQGGANLVKLIGGLNLTGTLSPSAFVSPAANPAASGIVRFASSDSQCWRNAANTADLCLSKNGSDVLLWPNAISAPSFTSTVSTGTAPFSVTSTTNVPNLNASSLNGATFAAPGPIGSTTPGSAAHTTISASGQITSTVSTGTAPLVVASTTQVANLNASTLAGQSAPASAIVGISDSQTLTNKTATSLVDNGTQLTAKRYVSNGTAPTCAVGGFGSGATCTVVNGNDSGGDLQVTTGTGPGSSGSITITFSSAWPTVANCVVMLKNGSGASWGARASIIAPSNAQAASNAFSANWDNNGASFGASITDAAEFAYVCFGK